jgi:thiol-disulfide isomerase/thioredoxin
MTEMLSMTTRTSRSLRAGLGVCLAVWLGIARGPVPALGSEAISWRSDLRSAEVEARAQDHLVWVQFTGSWCPNCVRLERESFVHPRVVGHARNSFVPVKLRCEEHEDLVDRFGLTGIPATILVAPSGTVIARHEGYVDTATFQAFLENALIRSGRAPQPADPGVSRPSPIVSGRGPGTTVEPPVALAGYCPVSLVRGHRLVPGQPALTVLHEGQVYRFAEDRGRDTFLKERERFIPVNGGRCPVSQVERGLIRPGEPQWSVVFRDHLYLCADAEGRARFLKDPERYAHVAVADGQSRPAPRGWDGLIARGATGASLAPTVGRSRWTDLIPLEARRPGAEPHRR